MVSTLGSVQAASSSAASANSWACRALGPLGQPVHPASECVGRERAFLEGAIQRATAASALRNSAATAAASASYRAVVMLV
jgi:hypothetical protein